MKVTATGFRRNMGANVLNDVPISSVKKYSADELEIYMNETRCGVSDSGLSIVWGKSVTLNGDYSMEIFLSKSDVVSLFKKCFGSILDAELMGRANFTLSPEYKREVGRGLTIQELIDG